MPEDARWLDADAAARYISVRADMLQRLVRAGKIPRPSYHLGPRRPRWDRLALDRSFEGGQVSTQSRQVVASVVADILSERPARRAADPRRRHG